MFKLGVEWWSEIFIFYGIISAVAMWEIGKFQKKRNVQLKRVENLEKRHENIVNEVLDLEDRIANCANLTKDGTKRVRATLKSMSPV